MYTDQHHTVQVPQVQVQYLCQWLEGKTPPAQVAEVDTTMCASAVFVPKVKVQGAKVSA